MTTPKKNSTISTGLGLKGFPEVGESVCYEVRDHVAYLTLNRPNKRNAINKAMRKEVQDVYLHVKHNPEVWMLVLAAKGPVFCSGKDLFEKISPEDDDGSVLSNDEVYAVQRSIYKPIICVVDGPCLAQGAGFALNSDIVLMSARGSIGWPQVSRGISSVSGPTFCAHAMPWVHAMGYLMRGEPIPAEECLRWGLVTELVPSEQLEDATHRWISEIMKSAPLAVRAIKEAARRGQDLAFEDRMYMARDVANSILSSHDSQEGILAFREKRKPVWTGQ